MRGEAYMNKLEGKIALIRRLSLRECHAGQQRRTLGARVMPRVAAQLIGSDGMATGRQARHRYQMSDVRQRQRCERPCVREVIHAEHRCDGMIGHSAALTIEHIPTEAMAELVHYDWPGHVRELPNV